MTQMHKQPVGPKPTGHGGHGLLMIACCIPMLILAVVLVAIGAVSPSFLVFAIGCTAMMALMMRGMHGDKGTAPPAPDQHPNAPQFETKGPDHRNPQ